MAIFSFDIQYQITENHEMVWEIKYVDTLLHIKWTYQVQRMHISVLTYLLIYLLN
jgi:hypothetical protein